MTLTMTTDTFTTDAFTTDAMTTDAMTTPAPGTTRITRLSAASDPTVHIETGDVLEVGPLDEPVTVMVLLASEHEVILDRLDESTPLVVRRDWLANARRFDPAA